MTKLVKARGYQIEMFERSMKENIIVAMDTGSGKTHIACMRIQAEVERCEAGPLGKRIWFLAPTVDLCRQQHSYLSAHMPLVGMRVLVGSDGVDRWLNQQIWDDVLKDMRVVISTHAVLSDALSHGFVKMTQLALIIFDEAHHCNRGHPANRIMKDFYYPLKDRVGKAGVPHILGLSASPILRSNITELEKIESNMDSIGVTPRTNRNEMEQYVHRPKAHILLYESCPPDACKLSSPALSLLQDICSRKTVRFGFNESGERLPDKVEIQLKKFLDKAIHIFNELGPWASDYFILESINALALRQGFDVEIEQQQALLKILRQGPLYQLCQTDYVGRPIKVSDKVKKLISFLEAQDAEKCSGLVFVQQRVTVSILCKLLSMHDRVAKRFDCATFVGMSGNAARKYNLNELLDLKAQRETLAEFKAKKKNLIIATDVLEEGIDVTACNLVFCFDPPPNVKSFIQRRGRARQEKSDYAIMFPADQGSKKIEQWRVLEAEMIRLYQVDQRKIKDLRKIEDETIEIVPGRLVVESTGACITPDSAVSHLHHFCTISKRQAYVQTAPTFSYQETADGQIAAKVNLPSTLHPSLRVFGSLSTWRTEAAATKDACFQAYSKLFEAGLLNDNLLPLLQSWTIAEPQKDFAKVRSSMAAVPRYNPWAKRIQAWSSGELYETQITIRAIASQHKDEDLHMVLITPWSVPPLASLQVGSKETAGSTVEFGSTINIKTDIQAVEHLRRSTLLLCNSLKSSPQPYTKADFVALFRPNIDDCSTLSWCEQNEGSYPLQTMYDTRSRPKGIIRRHHVRDGINQRYSHQMLFHNWAANEQVTCKTLARRNFTAPDFSSSPDCVSATEKSFNTFPIEACYVDRLHLPYARFSELMQPILRQVQSQKTAEALASTLLDKVPFRNLNLVLTAISAPEARLQTNYERLEFIGDTVLKFVVAHDLFCKHEFWPEGFLAGRKDALVSNQALAKAAMTLKLEGFIISDLPPSRRWRIPTITQMQLQKPTFRELSMKQLADTVEALFGAAYSDGGLSLARRCINVFIPEIDVKAPISTRNLAEEVITDRVLLAESLIGYHFKSKHLLLEALTHASYVSGAACPSYDRLEFLGDAILDMLVVSILNSSQHNSLQPEQLTQVKVATVNGHFLGFLCLELHNVTEGNMNPESNTSYPPVKNLASLLRHSSQDISLNMKDCEQRYESHRDSVRQALATGASYPWAQLTQLRIDKLYSDLIESIIGAIYIDSGSMAPCEEFLKRIGLVSYLERLTKDEVILDDPRNILSRSLGADLMHLQWRDLTQTDSRDCQRHACSVIVDGVILATTTDCDSKLEARMTAATIATEVLRDPVRLEAARKASEEDNHKRKKVAVDTCDDEGGMMLDDLEKGEKKKVKSDHLHDMTVDVDDDTLVTKDVPVSFTLEDW